MRIVEFFHSLFQNSEVAKQAAAAAPAAGGAAYSVLTLNGWVAVATLAYIAFQAIYLARKWWREEREAKKKK